MKRQILLFILILPFIMVSCGGDEPNELEKYEGTWNASISITTSMEGGESLTTESSVQVEVKAGENVLYINDQPYKVSGNSIIIPKATATTTMSGVTLETSTEAIGSLTDNKIEIRQIIVTKATYPDESVINTNQNAIIVLTR